MLGWENSSHLMSQKTPIGMKPKELRYVTEIMMAKTLKVTEVSKNGK